MGNFAGRLNRLEDAMGPEPEPEPGYIVVTEAEFELLTDETISDAEKLLIYDRHGMSPGRHYKVYCVISPDDWEGA